MQALGGQPDSQVPRPRHAGVPTGPWVLVVGMHRSGTSAVTGALATLGFTAPRPDDRVDWQESNPEHWESLSLSVYDNQLLYRHGGSWDAPPDLPDGWETRVDTSHLADPGDALAAAYPDSGPYVWKDPRLCLLLPYWRTLLPDPLPVIFIWRSPMAVAGSLRKRDGMDLVHGLALWERYNRSAIENLRGVDTFIASYDRLINEPSAFVESVAGWLGSLNPFVDYVAQWDIEGAAATLTTGTSRSVDDDRLLLDEQRLLVDALSMSDGSRGPLALALPGDESPWTTALIAAHRASRTRELERWKRKVDDMVGSTSWRITKPVRTLVSLAHHKIQPSPRSRP
jgi:hypothetical protein